MVRSILPILVAFSFSHSQTYHRMRDNYENGMPKEIMNYILFNERLVLVKRTGFYNNGENKAEENYLNGKKHGQWVEWYHNGHTKSEITYVDGLMHGGSNYWSPDGKESSELIWRNGKRFDGVWTDWYDNGQKRSEKGYKNGIPVGVYTYWYDNGQKRSVGTYTKDHKTDSITKHGKWIHWYKNGRRKEELIYNRGKKDGRWTHWYKNGQKESEVAYMDDIPIGENTYWYENGYRKSTAFIINGLPTDERCWNDDGIECECKGFFWEGCSGSTMAKMDGPCDDARYLKLIKTSRDDLTLKQKSYISSIEKDCAEYSSQQIVSDKVQKYKDRERIAEHKEHFEIPYVLSIYASFPGKKAASVENYAVYDINGIFIETPFRFNIGRLRPYLIVEYRNYNFINNSISPNFGGSAFIGGLKTSIRLFNIKDEWFQPYFSILTGKFHAGKGIIMDVGIPLLKVPRSPLIINSSVRANMVQKTGGSFTGWLDYGLFIGYPLYY